MSTKSNRAALRTAVREKSASLLHERGEVRPRQVAQMVCDENPDLIRELGDELAVIAVGRMASEQFRQWSTLKDAGMPQFHLPGIPTQIIEELPPTITIPVEGEEPTHVAIARATVGQLRAYEKLLADHIEASRVNHSAVLYIVQQVVHADPEMAITVALQQEEAA